MRDYADELKDKLAEMSNKLRVPFGNKPVKYEIYLEKNTINLENRNEFFFVYFQILTIMYILDFCIKQLNMKTLIE